MSPVRILNVVVFPAPLTPKRPKHSPLGITKLIPRTAGLTTLQERWGKYQNMLRYSCKLVKIASPDRHHLYSRYTSRHTFANHHHLEQVLDHYSMGATRAGILHGCNSLPLCLHIFVLDGNSHPHWLQPYTHRGDHMQPRPPHTQE